jgi:1-deoxy-D-xylulose-5-phosphate synthase
MKIGSIFQFFLRASVSNSEDCEESKVVKKAEDGWKIDFSSGEKPSTPLLDTIDYPFHMDNLSTQVKKNAIK